MQRYEHRARRHHRYGNRHKNLMEEISQAELIQCL